MQRIQHHELLKLRAVIDELIAFSGERPDPFRVVEIHENVIAFTKSVFPGEPHIKSVADPEIGNRKFVVQVAASGSVDELMELMHAWHSGIAEVAQELSHYYILSIDPIEGSDEE